MSVLTGPGVQFQANATHVIEALRIENSNLTYSVITQQSQLRAADDLVAELRRQLDEALAAAQEARDMLAAHTESEPQPEAATAEPAPASV